MASWTGGWRRMAGTISMVAATGVCGAQTSVTIPTPVYDVWMYPQAGSGFSDYAPIFGSPFNTPDPDRLGYYFLCFDTSAQLPPSAGPRRVVSATVTVRLLNSSSFDPADGVVYDATYDSVAAYLNASLDVDPGHPIELFGAKLNNGLTLQTWNESTTPVFQSGVYNAEPFDFDPAGAVRVVLSNVDQGFDVKPFAVATATSTYNGPGGTRRIADEAVLTFQLDVADPFIQQHLRQAVSAGRVGFVVSSLHQAGFMGGPGADIWPRLATKETFGLPDPTLTLVVAPLAPADLTGDGLVNSQDLAALLGSWGECPGAPGCAGDINADGLVNSADLAQMLGQWGAPQ